MFQIRLKTIPTITALAMTISLAGIANAAPTPGQACQKAVAKAMGTCLKKAAGQHATCLKKTGDRCATNDEKLDAARQKVSDTINSKCENATNLADAGYAGYSYSAPSTQIFQNTRNYFADECLVIADLIADRTVGNTNAIYDAATEDDQKCLQAALKGAGKHIGAVLGDASKCVEDGCTFDLTERTTKALTTLDKKCTNLNALTGSTNAEYVDLASSNARAAIASPCDPLDATRCAMPYPNDHFSLEGAPTPTGRRLAYGARAITAHGNGIPVDPTRWNEADGFSIGAMMLLNDVNIDLAQTGAAPITDIAQSIDADAPFVLIDAETGDKQIIWVERDSNGATIADQPIIGRVAKNLEENHRYVVALRNMKNNVGAPVPAGSLFAAYRDNTPTGIVAAEARRAHMEEIFAITTLAGITRSELYLAWDFTTQSSESTAGRLLEIRDDAFATLGASSPSFTVATNVDPPDPNISRQIDGTFEVPLYLNQSAPSTTDDPATLLEDENHVPFTNGEMFTASFRCIVPTTATAGNPARISMYGHGLLGSHTEVDAGNVRAFAFEHNIVLCATDWTGFADEDTLFALNVVTQFSLFPHFIDRQHQGILNQLFLGRLMKHASGFSSHVAFQDGITPLIDTSDIFYDGNSQGGILGGVLAAVQQDVSRFVLGVPGINYSTLLNRSVDFAPFEANLAVEYPNSTDRNLLLAFAQVIWDRTDPSGHINHLTADPYAGTLAKKVLYHVAYGDHQVAPVTAEVAARSIGASIHTPALDPLKIVPEVTPYYDIPAISYPFDGSALVIWDSGNPAPPTGNIPPPNQDPMMFGLEACTNDTTGDPHSCPRSDPDARIQKSEFLKTTGEVIDVCGGSWCEAQ